MARRGRGRRGDGSITQRDGRYLARVSRTEGGKRVRESKTFDLRVDAEWWLGQAKRGTIPEQLTVAAYLERWLGRKRDLRASTQAQYANHVRKHITPALGGFDLTDLTRSHVERFVDGLSRHVSPYTHRRLSPSTVRAVLVTLRSALDEAVPRDIPENPARRVHAPRVERAPVKVVGIAEARQVLGSVKGSWVEPIARFLFGSGLRIGEALSMNQSDIDWKAGRVRVRASKTAPRRLMVTPDAMDALRMALADAPRRGRDEPVFFSPRANRKGVRDRLSRHSVAHALPRLIPGVTPHGFRHAHATTRLELGDPVEVIAEQLGHKNPTMTRNVYAHVTERSQRAGLDALDDAVAER